MEEIKKIELRTKGMHCVSCENLIKESLLELNGVKNATVSYTTEKTTVEYDPTKTNVAAIMNTIKKAGYQPEEIGQKESKGFFGKIFK